MAGSRKNVVKKDDRCKQVQGMFARLREAKQRVEVAEAEIGQYFEAYMQDICTSWNPSIGDRVVYVNIDDPPDAYPLVVTDVQGKRIGFREHADSPHRIWLNLDAPFAQDRNSREPEIIVPYEKFDNEVRIWLDLDRV